METIIMNTDLFNKKAKTSKEVLDFYKNGCNFKRFIV